MKTKVVKKLKRLQNKKTAKNLNFIDTAEMESYTTF